MPCKPTRLEKLEHVPVRADARYGWGKCPDEHQSTAWSWCALTREIDALCVPGLAPLRYPLQSTVVRAHRRVDRRSLHGTLLSCPAPIHVNRSLKTAIVSLLTSTTLISARAHQQCGVCEKCHSFGQCYGMSTVRPLNVRWASHRTFTGAAPAIVAEDPFCALLTQKAHTGRACSLFISFSTRSRAARCATAIFHGRHTLIMS